MRFVTARVNGAERPGVVVGGEIVLLPAELGDLVSIIAGGEEAWEACAQAGRHRAGERIALAEADLAAPIRRFRRDVLCTGWNYWDHFEEGRGRREGQDVERPKAPTFFTKSPTR